jgi:serine/threonine-protein kinase
MIGQTLSRYRILAELGRGGMGVVCRAHDETLGRDVALKVLPNDSLADEAARRRLIEEARLASSLNHAHICTIYDAGESQGHIFIAMELVEGKPLREAIPAGGLPAESVLRYGAQIADALDHAHARGIVHRDLKSANVMVTPEGRAKILDFGLARRLRGEDLDGITRSRAALEDAGKVSGTLGYMAPEQLRGEPADERSDIWALGVVLYEVAAGTLPFQGRTGFELSSAILNESLAGFPACVPPGVRAVIQRCLAKEPAQRYQHASEVRAALDALATPSSASVAAPPVTLWKAGVSRRARVAGGGVLLVVGVLAAAAGLDWIRSLRPGAGPPKIESLAVLPLENLSGDPAQEYFADGMTEALIGNLTQIRALKVVSRTSAMRYKGSPKSLPEIARELGVDGVITGSIRRSPARVAISVQLIHAPTDRNLWASSYERNLADVLQLQGEVARAIASELRAQLSPGEEARLAGARPVDAEAYSLYLQGRYSLNKRSPEGMDLAIRYFSRVIERDAGFAPAYSGLADAYSLLGNFGASGAPLREARPRAVAAALKAVELNDSSAEAHTSLGFVRMRFEWEWAAAEREFRRAIELNPRYATAHHWYAVLLMCLGRTEESRREILLARELDPVSPIIANVVGLHFFLARDYDSARAWVEKTVELEPRFANAFYGRGRIHLQRREYDRAVGEMETAVRISNRAPFFLSQLARAYAHAGRTDDARGILKELLAGPAPEQWSYQLAEIHLALGEKEQALDWLERALEQRSLWMPYLQVAPELDPLRSEPRFQALLRQMNFPG